MLLQVTKEDITLNFRNYGKLMIPKGTVTSHLSATGIDENVNFITDYEWIDNQYPDFSNTLKDDIDRYGIHIPGNQLIFAIRLKFAYNDSGNCKDIFLINGKKKICRLQEGDEIVTWYTVTEDWEEPLCPLRTDMLIQVLGQDNKVVITEEQMACDEIYFTLKKFPFSWETNTEEQDLFKNIYNHH